MSLTQHEIVVFFAALGVLLAVARILGEIATRFRQPAVLGEIFAGVLLGPTLLGAVAPGVYHALFPSTGGFPIMMHGLTTLSITLFLLVAGMEVELSTIWRLGRSAALISVVGVVVPFILGFSCAWFLPSIFDGEAGASRLPYSLFLGTALSISALPVIAKILLDLGLYRSDLGMIIISVAVVGDLTGWMLFALILGMMGGDATAPRAHAVGFTIGMTILFAVLMLTVVRFLLDRALPLIQAYTRQLGGLLGLSISGALLCAAFTEWIGIHTIFGSFLFGVALGDSRHLREHTRSIIDQFISFIFAPLFFASIGLRVNFATNFDPLLVVLVLLIATAGKVFACSAAARWSGLGVRESWAIGFGMNARGAMEIILALLALESGLIGERMFVALVVMALVTTLISGSMIQRILGTGHPKRFFDFMSGKGFLGRLAADSSREGIAEIARNVSREAGLDPEHVAEAVWQREQLMPTGIGNSVAVPHARLADLKSPIVAVGFSREGLDFDSPDGRPAHLIFFTLLPMDDLKSQAEILADIARTFRTPEAVERVLATGNYTEFLAMVKSGGA